MHLLQARGSLPHLKYPAGRRRAYSYLPSKEAKPTFEGPFSKPPDGNSFNHSFPNGHTTASFAIATVFTIGIPGQSSCHCSCIYPCPRVVMNRNTENEHWSSDVLTGAPIGHLSGKQAVNNFHLLSKKRANSNTKNTLLLSLTYISGHLESGVVVCLR